MYTTYLVTFEPARDLTQIIPQTTAAILHSVTIISHRTHDLRDDVKVQPSR